MIPTMVIVDKLSRAPHFILVKHTYKVVNLAGIFMKGIFRLHGVPKVIVSYRDVNFTKNFWKASFKCLGTPLNFSTAYHPRTNG